MDIETIWLTLSIARHIIQSVREHYPDMSEEKCLLMGHAIVKANFQNCLKTKLKTHE